MAIKRLAIRQIFTDGNHLEVIFSMVFVQIRNVFRPNETMGTAELIPFLESSLTENRYNV